MVAVLSGVWAAARRWRQLPDLALASLPTPWRQPDERTLPVANRDQHVRETFVELADTLASDYDVGEFLHLLVHRCQAILDLTTAGVLVETPEGDLRLAAATSAGMLRLARAEIDQRDGPCYEAYRRVAPVISQDLRKERERWPQVIEEALDLGARAAYAFPLRLRGDCIGALNLYRDVPGAFHDDDIQLGQAFADVATIGILQERKVDKAERRAEHLQHALDSRTLIEQAKGITAERQGIGVSEAFDRLRSHARSNNRKLRDVCRDVINGALDEV